MPIATFFRLPFAFLTLLVLFALLCARPAHGEEPLEAEKAFAMSARAAGPATVEVTFEIAPGYYLYGERFKFAATPPEVTLGEAERAPGERHQDPFFGEVETYRDRLRMRLPVSAPAAVKRFTLTVTSQGCWDGGVCYPPTTQHADVDLTTSTNSGGADWLAQALEPRQGASDAALSRPPAPAAGEAPPASGDDSGRLAQLLAEANAPLVLMSFFGLGLLLAFTPCTFPMIPILSGIVLGTGPRASRGRALALSLAYVLGMAITYAAAGVAAGLTGTLLAAVLQNAWILAALALVFVALALSMFGLYELRLPAALETRLTAAANREKGGHLGGVAAMGALSALILGPCVTAPLAGALLYIARTGDAILGGCALFVLALGMGMPLVVLALAARSVLPKSGPWMEWVRKAAGVLLLLAAAWVISPVLPNLSGEASGVGEVGEVSKVGAAGKAGAAAHPPFERIGSEAELDAKLAANGGRAVMLDFYADWCASCKVMERDTFSNPAVAAHMGRMLLLQADVTAYNDEHRALLRRFDLVGPPGIVFFDAAGRQIQGLRVAGFMPPRDFAALLERAR
ncbi:MAG: protein-disulfide reductase DsbD [Azoarcus sp.]|jgi:thiol:disulfide interchange protein DsbD|nr:protein-disulfide reductase DsbD [Azoarcus sp.]